MCGICGIRGHYKQSTVRVMTEAMIHRGPDSDGFFMGPNCGLGMRRLKIIDLEGSDQPISNEDESLVMICNGEIYNTRSLRAMLEDRGHQFTTNGDVEVIVHLYEEFHENCCQYLEGMFAFAVYDNLRNQLFVARDRMGIKPLYWAKLPGTFIFASEIRSIISTGLIPKEICEEAVLRYLAYPAVPAPLTIFRQIQALAPAHALMVDNAGIRNLEYWDVEFPRSQQKPLSFQESKRQLRDTLTQAVKERLVSDVPLGAFLSGGIDSSAVVGLMSTLSTAPVKTFSIRFTGADKSFNWFDDASYASTVAKAFGTDHTEEIVTGTDIYNNLLDAVWAMDQPSGDAIQYYMVSKAARKGVTVALSGTGGDEVFAGYEWFKELRKMDALHKRIAFFTHNFGDLTLSFLQQLPREFKTSRIRHKIETLLLGHRSFFDRYRLNRRMYRGDEWFYLFSSDFITKIVDFALDSDNRLEILGKRCEALDTINSVSYLQMKTDLPNLLLRDQDAVSMAHNLEVRLPLIDRKVVELAAKISPQYKLHGDSEKFILRESLSDLLPQTITQRKKKGFIFPMGQWMRGDLRTIVESCLSESATKKRNIFDPQTITQLKKDFFNGKQPFFKIWNQVVFELWCRIAVDREDGWKRPVGQIEDFI